MVQFHIEKKVVSQKVSLLERWVDVVQNYGRGHFAVFALIIVPFSTTGTALPLERASASLVAQEAREESGVENLVRSVSDRALFLTEEIVFEFSQPIQNDLITLTLYPRTAVKEEWSEDRTRLSVTPLTQWQQDTKYSLAFNVAPHTSSVIYHFRSESLPRIAKESIPEEHGYFFAEKDASITLHMDRDLESYDFKVIPRVQLPIAVAMGESGRNLHVTFLEDLEEHKDVSFVLYAKHRDVSEKHFAPVEEVKVRMAAPQPDVWPVDQGERIALLENRVLPRVTEGKYVDINLKARVTTLFEDGEVIHMFFNSPGAPETPTPPGEYRVENKARRALSASFGVYLPFWMAFTADGKYGLHDLIEWPEDHPERPEGVYKESASSIDRAVSPGCVRHTPSQSQTIYEWAPVGTPVIIY